MEQGRERKKRRKKKKKKKEKEDKVKNKAWNRYFGFWYEFPWRIDAPWSRVLEEITETLDVCWDYEIFPQLV